MENMKKYGKDAMTVYLTVDEKGETQNVFATVGMAIDAIAYDKGRIMPDHIIEETMTSYKWKGNDGKTYSLEIRECPVCKDVTCDYMNRPRVFTLNK